MEQRQDILRRINWDYDYSVEEIDRILKGNDFSSKKPFLIKLLKSVRWYNLILILDAQEMREILSPEIIDNLPVASMKDKYRYARQLLYG